MSKVIHIQKGCPESKKQEYHFPNMSYASIDRLFNYNYNELKTIIETSLQSKTKHVELLCSISVIYIISFNQSKLQHMKFVSKKFRNIRKYDIFDLIQHIKKNLAAKMCLFCDSNDRNPYYIIQKIESMKCIIITK